MSVLVRGREDNFFMYKDGDWAQSFECILTCLKIVSALQCAPDFCRCFKTIEDYSVNFKNLNRF